MSLTMYMYFLVTEVKKPRLSDCFEEKNERKRTKGLLGGMAITM